MKILSSIKPVCGHTLVTQGTAHYRGIIASVSHNTAVFKSAIFAQGSVSHRCFSVPFILQFCVDPIKNVPLFPQPKPNVTQRGWGLGGASRSRVACTYEPRVHTG